MNYSKEFLRNLYYFEIDFSNFLVKFQNFPEQQNVNYYLLILEEN